MLIQNIKAATIVVRTIRDDWDQRTVYTQIEELAGGDYTHADVLWACITIAENLTNRAPATITLKAGELLERRNHKQSQNRTRTGSAGRRDDQFLCDVCNKPEAQCQTAATNLNGSDHAFVSIHRGNQDRDQMHADGRIAAARANAIQRVAVGLFKLPADVTTPQHPEPEQESA